MKKNFRAFLLFLCMLFVSSCNVNRTEDSIASSQTTSTTSIPKITSLTAKCNEDGIKLNWTNPRYDDHAKTILKIYDEDSILVDTIDIDPALTSYQWSNGTHGEIYGFALCVESSNGNTSGTTSTNQFFIDSQDTSALPIIYINTENNASIKSKDTYIPASVSIIDPSNPDNNLSLTGYNEKIRGRGNSTWRYDKKPYKIKFASKQSLFGMDKAKQWVLLANWLDPTMLGDSIAFKIAQVLGMEYNHHAIHVELVLNGEYVGAYVLTEQTEVGKGRVDIDKTEGFLCELDDRYDSDPKFKTSHYRLPVSIKSPEIEDEFGQEITDINNAAFSFVIDALNTLDSALYNVSKKDKNLSSYQETLYNTINVDSFAKYLLVNEIVDNNEIRYPKSVYIYKDKDSKICAGPVWDFDWAWGHTELINTYFTNSSHKTQIGSFFTDLYNDSVFRTTYKSIWNSKYNELLSIENDIRAEAAKVKQSFAINYKKWPNRWYNKNYDEMIDSMVSWYISRLNWLNTEINKL